MRLSAESCPYMVIYWQDILPFCWVFCAVTLMDGSQIDFFMKVFFLGCEWDADMTSFKQMYFIDFSKAVLQTKLQCFLRYFSELSHFLLKLE